MSRLIAVVERPSVSKCLLIFSIRPVLGLGIEDGLPLGEKRPPGDLDRSPRYTGLSITKSINRGHHG